MSHVNHRRKNPVARVLNRVHRPATHRSIKDYRRRAKHQDRYFGA